MIFALGIPLFLLAAVAVLLVGVALVTRHDHRHLIPPTPRRYRPAA